MTSYVTRLLRDYNPQQVSKQQLNRFHDSLSLEIHVVVKQPCDIVALLQF